MPPTLSTKTLIVPHFDRGRSIAATVTALVVGVALAGCGAASREHIIIRVGTHAITESLLIHWTSVMAPRHAEPEPPDFSACIKHLTALALYPAARPQLKEACRHEYAELRQSALHFLITNQWLIDEAADQRTGVSDQEITRRLSEKYGSSEGHLEYQALQGVGGHTTTDIRLEVQAELAALAIRRRLLAYSLAVSPEEVASYYKHNVRSFYLPDRRYVELIGNLSESATVKRILAKVRRGASFSSMSFHEWLAHPNYREIGREKRILYEAIFRSKPNVVVGPLSINGYYFLFRVTKISPAKIQSLAEADSIIKKELGVRRRVRFVKAWRTKWTEKTSCAPGYVVQKCKQYHGPTAPEDPLDVN